MEPKSSQLRTVVKEMGLTHREFFEKISRLLQNIPYEQKRNLILFEISHKKVEIQVEEERVRVLSRSARLPVTPITIRFYQFTETESNAFIEKFNLCFLKGGG